jgi:hypothetical protein
MSSLKFRTTLTGPLLERVVSEDVHSRYLSEAALENDLAEQASQLGYALGVGETKLIGRQADLRSSASAGRGLTLDLLLIDRSLQLYVLEVKKAADRQSVGQAFSYAAQFRGHTYARIGEVYAAYLNSAEGGAGVSPSQALEELAAFAGINPEEQELAERACALPSVVVVSLSVTSEEINTAQALDSVGVASYVIQPWLYPVGDTGEYVLELRRLFPSPDVSSAGASRPRNAAAKNRLADNGVIPVEDRILLCLLLAETEHRLVAATALRKRSGDSNRFTELYASYWGSGLLGSTTASDIAGRTKTYIHLTDSGREAAKTAAERASARGLTYRDVARHAGADVPGDADQDGGFDAETTDEIADMSFS